MTHTAAAVTNTITHLQVQLDNRSAESLSKTNQAAQGGVRDLLGGGCAAASMDVTSGPHSLTITAGDTLADGFVLLSHIIWF